MIRSFWLSPLVALTAVMASAQMPQSADAQRGAEFFRQEKCTQCHSVAGVSKATSPHAAPDLGRDLGRDYTPAGIVSRMWNHAPTMWGAMRAENITPPAVNEGQAADLFAFFYSVRYFEKPADAGRGKRVFAAKHCAECHPISANAQGVGPSVAKWDSLADPVVLVQQMWNHASGMKEAFAKRNLKWSELEPEDMDDMLLYLRSLPETRNVPSTFNMPLTGPAGAELFKAKACADCHKDAMALENKLKDETLAGVAAAMWDHAPQMKQVAPVSSTEMRQLISYVWARQFFQASGDANRGKRVFASKNCAGCHDSQSNGAPSLANTGPYSAIKMVAVLWKHGPRMYDLMQTRKLGWPKLTAEDVSDLVAYLDTRK